MTHEDRSICTVSRDDQVNDMRSAEIHVRYCDEASKHMFSSRNITLSIFFICLLSLSF